MNTVEKSPPVPFSRGSTVLSLTIGCHACIILLTGQFVTDQSVISLRRHGCAEAEQKRTREAEPT
jgi:hypothetical protein